MTQKSKRGVLDDLIAKKHGVEVPCQVCGEPIALCAPCFVARESSLDKLKCSACKRKKRKQYASSFVARRNSADRSKAYRDRQRAMKEALKEAKDAQGGENAPANEQNEETIRESHSELSVTEPREMPTQNEFVTSNAQESGGILEPFRQSA